MGDNSMERYSNSLVIGDNSGQVPVADQSESEEEVVVEEYETFFVPSYLVTKDQCEIEDELKKKQTGITPMQESTDKIHNKFEKRKEKSQIKTITCIDEETDNVVILIRPRRRSGSPVQEGSIISTNNNSINTSKAENLNEKVHDGNNFNLSETENLSNIISISLQFENLKKLDEPRNDSNGFAKDELAYTCNDEHVQNLENTCRSTFNDALSTEQLEQTDNLNKIFFNDITEVYISDLKATYENQGARPKTTSNTYPGSNNMPTVNNEMTSNTVLPQDSLDQKIIGRFGISQEANKKVKKLKEMGAYDDLVKCSSLPKNQGVVHDLVKKTNMKNVDPELTEEDDILIWKLMKSLKAREHEIREKKDVQGVVEALSDTQPKEKCDWTYEKATMRKDKYLSRRLQTKEIGQVKVITFLSPSKENKELKIKPLQVSRTLPFNVKNIFQQKMDELKNNKCVCLTGGKELMFTTINIDHPYFRYQGIKNGSSDLNVPVHQSNVYQMSSSNLVLSRPDLIGLSKSSSSSGSTIGSYKSSSSSSSTIGSSRYSSSGSGSVIGSYKFSSTDSGSDIGSYKITSSGESTIDNSQSEFDTNANIKDSTMVEQTYPPESSTSSGSLSDSFEKAINMLNTSQLDEAEKQFLFLYQQMQEKSEDTTQIMVQTLDGLADVCARRSRMCRSNPMEWQWLCMHAIALLQYTVEICETELETELENHEVEWYMEQKHALENKCKPLEDSLNRALYNCMKHEGRKYLDPFRSFSLPNTPGTPSRSMFPLSTGNKFTLYPSMHSQIISGNKESQSTDDSEAGLSWLSKFHKYCNDRLQTNNVGNIFNRLFVKKQNKQDNEDTESICSDISGSSLDWDHSVDLDRVIGEDQPMVEEKDSPVKEHSLGFELSASDINNEGWEFFLGDRKNCTFESVVQVASKPHNKNGPLPKDIIDIQQQESIKEKEIISPLHDHSIKLTLSKCYAKLADKLLTEEEYSKAEVIYEEVIEIIEEIQDGTAGMLRFYARLLKNCGTVKSKQGKMSQGLSLLTRALETYRDLQDEEANFEIALALLELGNGYITGRDKDNAVFSYAINAICEFFEKDTSDEITSSTSSTKSEVSSPEKLEEERNIDEAIQCYREALHLLRDHESKCEEKQTDLVARSTRRLADCYFMQKEYDRALDCYEKALTMFRNTASLGRDIVLENAHVMCMLGVSSFMLLMYPRAASTFELALHMVKYAFSLTSTFFHGLLLALMGITFYKMRHFHRCVSMCFQAFEIFCALHGDKLPQLPKHKFWLVCQVLYVMGNSYNNLNLHQKAIKYLTVARSVLMASKNRDRRQFMRVLQILGDCYFAQYDYKSALQFYNEALEYGDCESQISFGEVFDANATSDEMSMHNQLVSKSAEAHISMQQYQNAVHYLEQAHDMQESMGDDIKGDLATTLHSLGQMYCGAGDVEKAIESYNESLEVYREIHNGKLGPEVISTLGNIAAMCYVKACLCDDVDSELEMIVATEKYFQEALKLGKNAVICVRYATFLYSQGNYKDAITNLQSVLDIDDIESAPDLVYGGLEKVTLPDVLQDEVDCQEEVVLPPSSLARYLLILSHKRLGNMKSAEENLIDLLIETLDYDIPILFSVLGYSMMEMGVIEEAIWCFGTAISMENDYRLAIDNFCTCVYIWVLQTLQRAVEVICSYYGICVNPMYLSTTSESSYSNYLF